LSYKNPDRLADVLALIQVLALHAYRHRSDSGLTDDLPGEPTSSRSWEELARDHQDFFRVDPDPKKNLRVSLVATHVLPKDKEGERKLPPGFLTSLLQTAITLNNIQVERANRWKSYLPVLAGIGGATDANVEHGYLKGVVIARHHRHGCHGRYPYRHFSVT